MAVIKDLTKADILEMARKLPWEERWELIRELSATIPLPPPDRMTPDEFRAELDRRSRACDSGQMTEAPWQEVLERLERKNRTDG